MKKAHLRDLRAQLLGSVTDSQEIREHFATDGSIFQALPEAVVLPANTADVCKAVRVVAERAAAGKPTSLVPRGAGTDLSGAAIGEGIQLVFTGGMNNIVKQDKRTVTVQPGLNFAQLQQALHGHGRWLPAYPASQAYSTIGGAIVNGAGGIKSLKYDTMRRYVRSLKVVLSDGSLIDAHRISARELNRKKGQTTLEGQIYRQLDSVILDNEALIKSKMPDVPSNVAGYAINRVRGRDGSFDLSQVIIGSQGTLGIVTEAVLSTVARRDRATLVVGHFDDLHQAGEAVAKLLALRPSALELINHGALTELQRLTPHDLDGVIPEQLPKIMLLVEFDDASQVIQTMHVHRAHHVLQRFGVQSQIVANPVKQTAFWKIRQNAGAIGWLAGGTRQPLPMLDDAAVPVTQWSQYLTRLYRLLEKHDIDAAICGSVGTGRLQAQPQLDLARKKDQERLAILSREHTELVANCGGTISSFYGDGLIRGPWLRTCYGDELFALMEKVKTIFDPDSIFNPGKKTQATEEQAHRYLREAYSTAKFTSQAAPHF